MNSYSIWSEGYIATGQRATASLHGFAVSENFKGACKELFKDDQYFNENNLTYYGCKLFDNEYEARESYG